MKVLGLSGSLRDASYNTTLLRAAADLLPHDVEFELWDGLKAIPPYDEDDDVEPAPAAVAALRAAIAGADAVLIATPEYNASIPGALKNALDWVSAARSNPLRNKPAAVIGASTGAFGAVWAQAELRKVLGTIGARVLEGDVAVGHAPTRFDEHGRLTDEQLLEQLRRSSPPSCRSFPLEPLGPLPDANRVVRHGDHVAPVQRARRDAEPSLGIAVAHFDEPPPEPLGDVARLRAADAFREANELRAWVDVENGRIVDHGRGGRGSSPARGSTSPTTRSPSRRSSFRSSGRRQRSVTASSGSSRRSAAGSACLRRARFAASPICTSAPRQPGRRWSS